MNNFTLVLITCLLLVLTLFVIIALFRTISITRWRYKIYTTHRLDPSNWFHIKVFLGDFYMMLCFAPLSIVKVETQYGVWQGFFYNQNKVK